MTPFDPEAYFTEHTKAGEVLTLHIYPDGMFAFSQRIEDMRRDDDVWAKRWQELAVSARNDPDANLKMGQYLQSCHYQIPGHHLRFEQASNCPRAGK